MHLVTLDCRSCDAQVSFASGFMADEEPTLSEMQQHMDLNFLARCGTCAMRDWEVVDIKPGIYTHGRLDILHIET